jgi:hypothetical protein
MGRLYACFVTAHTAAVTRPKLRSQVANTSGRAQRRLDDPLIRRTVLVVIAPWGSSIISHGAARRRREQS